MSDINVKLGKKIRIILKKKGLSQEELAFESKTDYSYLNEIEAGKRNPSVKRLEKLAKALKVSVKELFDRAQEQLETNQKYNKRNKTYEYFLSGKVYCGCGAKRVGDGVNGHHYYRCSQRIYKFPIPNKCTYQGVNAKILDEMVWNKLLSLLSNPEIIKDQLERWKKKQSKLKASSNSSVSLGKSALEGLKEEEDRYTQAFGSNIFSFEKYKELMKEVNSKRKAIEDRVEENSKNVGSNFDFEDVDSVCKEVMEDLRNITKEKKQKYMRGMIESIYVKERSSAVVNGYIPLAIQAQNIQYESISRYSWPSKCR